MNSLTPPNRLHALDAARAGALLLGIVLHATMSFFFVIPARDVSQSGTLAVLFFVIHTFRMTLFFVLAGFFAHLLLNRRGVRGFVKDRAKRVLAPLTVGWLLLAPPTIAAVIWGLTRTFPGGATEEAAAPQGFPLVHLWFLYYLAIFYVLALVIRFVCEAFERRSEGGATPSGRDRWLDRAFASPFAPLLLGTPTAALLFFKADWAVWFGIPTPDNGLTPQLPALVAYGAAFAFGWVLHRRAERLETLARQWPVNVGLGVALTVVCLGVGGWAPNLEATSVIEGGATMRWVYTAAYALSVWAWTFGLLGVALRFASGESRLRRYLSDASYWLYLVHPPIVFGLQVLLMQTPLHWSIKFPAILIVTMTVLLWSYHYLVRPTALGEILNGRRYPRGASITADRSAPPARLSAGRVAQTEPFSRERVAPVAELVDVTKRYGKKTVALDGVSLSVRPGELLAVLGPNGAGKSTAIGLWLGTLQPDAGEARVLGGSPLDANSRLGAGVMMQEVTLGPMLTAREHVVLTTSYYRDPLSPDEALALTATGEFAERRYGKLSAGQKRQVQFAIAVCGRPRLLFLDEPTVGLDVQARVAMWKAIRKLRDDGCSIVLTTHYLEEAEALADRVVVLAKGRQIAEGTVAEMRALVSRKRIRFASTLDLGELKTWPGVIDASRDAALFQLTAFEAESVVRRLLAADPDLSHLEVHQASLADAFAEITKEAA